jgi:hypothetical protein
MIENRVFSFAIFLIGRGFLYIFSILLGCVLIYINTLSVRGKEETFFAFKYCGCHRPILFLM